MFNPEVTLKQLNEYYNQGLSDFIGVEFIEIGKNYLKARMPIDFRTVQPHGQLHGGASVVLAETLGSVGASLTLNNEKQIAAGVEINSNHLKSATEGFVTGITTPIHRGRKIQVWEIKITDEKDQLINVSRITLSIINRKK